MQLPQYAPFPKLEIRKDEQLVWYGSDLNEERSGAYGIAVTDAALYLYSPFWLALARWRRYALADIRSASFRDSRWFPKLQIDFGNHRIKFRTPCDFFDQDVMDSDRKLLAEAVAVLGRSFSMK